MSSVSVWEEVDFDEAVMKADAYFFNGEYVILNPGFYILAEVVCIRIDLGNIDTNIFT